MKNVMLSVICLAMAIMILPSCVSKRRYVDARRAENDMRNKNVALQNQIRDQEDSINRLKGNVNALGDVYQSTSNELNMSKEQIAAQRERLTRLEALIDQQQKNTEALKEKVAQALVGFNTSDLTISMKNGKVYVSMQESLLFPSGSAVVNPRGKEALAKVAGVLNTNPDINVEVEGHTDSVKMHNRIYVDNWALSVARATAITRVLIDDYNVSPTRITASGRSKYDPVASNETTTGRALNRRTEIILQPKLDQLMDLINGSTNSSTAGISK